MKGRRGPTWIVIVGLKSLDDSTLAACADLEWEIPGFVAMGNVPGICDGISPKTRMRPACSLKAEA